MRSFENLPARRYFHFMIGLLLGLATPMAIGEAYVRAHPPNDILAYLGEASPLSGVYRPDPIIGADYRSPADFRDAYRVRLGACPGKGLECSEVGEAAGHW